KELADYLIQNTLWWIEYSGIDGIRMDTYVYPYQEYMARWASEVLKAYPKFNIVGESWVETVAHESYWQKDLPGENDGYDSKLPSVTDFQIHFAIRDAFNSPFGWESGIMKLYYALSQDRLYSDPMKNVIFLDNHDIGRIYSTLGEDPRNLKMAYAYLMTTRGIPQVYYGTELAFKQGPGNWGDGAKRAEMPGGWNGDSRSVFTKEGRTTDENDMHAFVTKITNWRKTSDAVKHGKLLHFVPENNVYVFFRYTDKDRVMVIVNMNDTEIKVSRQKHIEMLRGYTFGMDVVTGKNFALDKDFSVPGKTTTVLSLK
ncbi:MAG TPA: cyclomaltodextrinase C-terminal domain-containing protein, partial [Roseivirga sp.]